MVKIFDRKTNELKRNNKQTKILNKLKSYEDFVIEIAKAFNIKDKNKICLIAITNDEDEIPIKNGEDYTDYLNDLKQYLFYLEEEEKNEPEKQKLNEDFNLNININLSVEEITNNLKCQMKEPEKIIDENDNNFDINKYKEEQKSKNKILFDDYSQIFNSELTEIFNKKRKLMTNLIIEEKNEFSKFCLKNINTLNDEMNETKDEFSKLVNDFSQLYNKADEIVDILSEEINIRFLDDNLELEKTVKEAKYINIKNITIENIGFKTYESLFFIKDEHKSSKEIVFNQNYLMTSKNKFQLTLDGNFSHGKKESHQFVIKIENAKPNYEYTLYLIVKEEEKGIRLSKPFKISVKIKDDLQIKEAEKIYDELDRLYDLSELFDKEEVINKIINEKFSKDMVKIWVQTKMQEKNNNNAEKIFNELNNQFNILNYGFDKLEIINQILEENYNRDKLRDWAKHKIESKKAELQKLFDFENWQ